VYPDVAFSKRFPEKGLYGESSGRPCTTLHAYTVTSRRKAPG
jgi:hypothetical protein